MPAENQYRIAVGKNGSTGSFYPASSKNGTDIDPRKVPADEQKTYPSLLSDGQSGWHGCGAIWLYVLVHLATLAVTMSAGIIYHSRLLGTAKDHEDKVLSGDESLWVAAWFMIILEPVLVVLTLLLAWSPRFLCGCCSNEVTIATENTMYYGHAPVSYTFVNQLLMGGFFIVFAATLKLNTWLTMQYVSDAIKDDLKVAHDDYTYDPRSLIPIALYLQCIVLGFTIMNPIGGIAKYIDFDRKISYAA